jgi:hypothetical protein
MKAAVLAIAIVSALVIPAAARAQSACTPAGSDDWMGASTQQAIEPSDCALAARDAVDFAWPDLGSDTKYQVTLTYPDGATRSKPTAINYIHWGERLEPGSYSWQVSAYTPAGTHRSRARRFTVN